MFDDTVLLHISLLFCCFRSGVTFHQIRFRKLENKETIPKFTILNLIVTSRQNYVFEQYYYPYINHKLIFYDKSYIMHRPHIYPIYIYFNYTH